MRNKSIGHPLHAVYRGMIARCYYKSSINYKDYGARGITVCEDWRRNFASFCSSVGDRPTIKHTLDRIDNNRGYEPGNVKWSTKYEQGANKRNCRKFNVYGFNGTMQQLCRIFKIPQATVWNRLNRGIDPKKAFTVQRYNVHHF